MEQTIFASEIAQQCAEMAAILGIDEPVSEAALRAAIANSTYAHNLLVCRGNAEYLNELLANPPRHGPEENSFSTSALLRRAAESLTTWAKTGFSTVDKDTYSRRLESCAQCPHLHSPPENRRVIYRIAGVKATDRAVCRKCGCVVAVKARRVTDTCPDSHPEAPGLNRWNEPIPVEA